VTHCIQFNDNHEPRYKLRRGRPQRRRHNVVKVRGDMCSWLRGDMYSASASASSDFRALYKCCIIIVIIIIYIPQVVKKPGVKN